MSVYEIDCTTGEGTFRPLTQDEQDALDQAQADADIQRQAQQWDTVHSIRGSQLRQTDYSQEPFTADLPDDIQNAFKDNEVAWADFRQALRDITEGAGDPATLVWPTLPPAPSVVITPPPAFTDWTSWGTNWTPAP